LKIGLKYSHDSPSTANAFAAVSAADSPVCNLRCPRCCDTRDVTPPPLRSSSSHWSHSSSSVGSPSRTFSAMATPVNTYWRDQGLDHLTSTVSTTPMPGPPSCQLLPKTQKNPPLTPTACDFFPASSSCFGSVQDFFLQRALHLEGCCFCFCISLCLCLEG